jgi:biopolymer transport protein ExbD
MKAPSSSGRVLRRYRPRSSQLYCRIDTAGFASVIIALLALLMGNSYYDQPPFHRTSVTLAKVKHGTQLVGAVREDALLATVTRDSKIYFLQQQVSAEELPDRIKSKLKEGAPRTVYLKVDARARYKIVLEALAAIQASGLERVAFITESSSTKPGGR